VPCFASSTRYSAGMVLVFLDGTQLPSPIVMSAR
jgi:hypothetical protein